jgi:hypothetical protein
MSGDEPTTEGVTADDEAQPGGERGSASDSGGVDDTDESPPDGGVRRGGDARPDQGDAARSADAGVQTATGADQHGETWGWLPRPLAVALPFTEASSGAKGLSRGEVFELLSNERRRYVIRYLQSNGGTGELGNMATQVAAWEHDVEPERVDSTERKRAYTTLQQSHLPKMDDMGAVDYDSDSGHVEATDALGAVDIYLEIVPGGELAWKEYYLALSIVSVALVAVVAVGGVYPFALLPDVFWAAVIAFAFLVSAAVHVYLDRSILLGETE